MNLHVGQSKQSAPSCSIAVAASTNGWLRKCSRAASVICSQITLERIAECTMVASIALGTYVATSSSHLSEKLDGLGIAAYGSVASCLLWSMGAALKGNRTKAAKCLVLAVLVASMIQNVSHGIGQEHNSLVLQFTRQNSQFYSDKEIKTNLNREIASLRTENGHIKPLNERIKSLETRISSFEIQIANKNKKIDALMNRPLYERIINTDIPEIASEGRSVNGRHITFGTTYIAENDPKRQALAQLVDDTHKEYAERWGLRHRTITENKLKNKCYTSTYDTTLKNCVPYWNKIEVLREWLAQPARKDGDEEWYILADDDMPVTNMGVDPFAAIDTLRRDQDASIIVAEDPNRWKSYYNSVNTGLLFVRKDAASEHFFNQLWATRNEEGSGSLVCKTLGTCENQSVLHEQEGMARLIERNRSLLDHMIKVVKYRDTYNGQEIALNTFSREGCFIRKQQHWSDEEIGYNDPHEGMWRKGDWIGQTAGVPTWGWYCNDKRADKPPGPLRQDKLKIMIDQIVR